MPIFSESLLLKQCNKVLSPMSFDRKVDSFHRVGLGVHWMKAIITVLDIGNLQFNPLQFPEHNSVRISNIF